MGLLLISPGAFGQDSAQKEKGLELIETAAVKFCQSIPVEQTASGTKVTAQGKAEVKAEVNGLIGKFANLGGNLGGQGAVEHFSNQSRGVLQQDLAAAITKSNDCRLHVLDVLYPAFLGTSTDSPGSPPASENKPAEAAGRPTMAIQAPMPAPKSYWGISVPSPTGANVQWEVLASGLGETREDQILSYIGAESQDSARTPPAHTLVILSLDVSPTSGPGCPAIMVTLQYELSGSSGIGQQHSVQGHECYGADGEETERAAIQNAVANLRTLLGEQRVAS
jgi:hypothetical protein